jgi:hypothetical protein
MQLVHWTAGNAPHFSFRLNLPYSEPLLNTIWTVAAIQSPLRFRNLLQGLPALCRMVLRGRNSPSARPK